MAAKEKPKYNINNNLFSTGIWLALISLLAGSIHLYDYNGITLIPSSKIGLSLGALLIVTSLAIRRSLRFELNIINFSFGLLFFVCSSWLALPYNLIQGPLIRGEILVFSLLSGLLLYKWPKKFIKILPYICVGILVYALFSTSDGRLLYSDDHPTFFYRLSLLKENFPNIPFYSPIWNGGFDARDFFATGALNIFLLASPIVYLFPLELSYNFIVALVLFGLVPLSMFFATRLAGGCRTASAISAVLSISASLLWYRWALKYGTMGFITSIALFPLVLSLAIKFLAEPEDRNWKEVILCALSFTLMLFWSASGLAILPLVVFAFVFIKRWIGNKKILALAAILCAINLPWISVFWTASNVGNFIKSEKPTEVSAELDREGNKTTFKHKAGEIDLKESLSVLRENSVSANPIILILALPGLLLINKRYRLMFGGVYAWLLFMGTVAVPLKPQLELDRMLVILFQALSLPAALSIRKLISEVEEAKPFIKTVLPAFIFGILITGVFSTGSILSNRTLEQFFFSAPIVDNIKVAIKDNTDKGRVLFSGFMLHQLNGGHIGPLAIQTKKPLIASSYLHNLWKYKQVFPKEYISRKDEGIEEYLDVYNVENIFAHERKWREYFYSRPEKYTPIWKEGLFHMFKRNNFKSNYFLEGAGVLTNQNLNSISIRPSTKDVVLKFNYFPFLQSSSCKISPFEKSENVRLIKLSNCTPGKEVVINSVSAFKRTFLK